jgi:hypothetical protein
MLTDKARRHVETALMVLPPLAVFGVMIGDAPVAWRSAVAGVFFLVSPGLAVLAPARFRLEVELAMLLPTSIATTSLVSLVLFYAGVWTPMSTLACLAGLCALGVTLSAARNLVTATAGDATSGLLAEADYGWGDVT